MGILHHLGLGVAAVLTGLWIFGLPDGQTFCARSEDRPSTEPPPSFFFDGTQHVNKGGRACVQDIVRYSIEYVSGADELIGTDDDRLTLQEHFDLVQQLLHQEYPTTYFINSPWHFNHNAAVLGQMRMLYGDGNEYILIFGNPIPSSGYSGKYVYDCHDFQIRGEQENFYLGETTPSLYTPNWKAVNANRTESERKEMRPADFAMVLRAGTRKGYCQKGGGWMIEYGHGNLVPAIYDGIIQPTLFVTNDWSSLYTSLRYIIEGFVMNNLRKWNPSLGAHKTGRAWLNRIDPEARQLPPSDSRDYIQQELARGFAPSGGAQSVPPRVSAR